MLYKKRHNHHAITCYQNHIKHNCIKFNNHITFTIMLLLINEWIERQKISLTWLQSPDVSSCAGMRKIWSMCVSFFNLYQC